MTYLYSRERHTTQGLPSPQNISPSSFPFEIPLFIWLKFHLTARQKAKLQQTFYYGATALFLSWLYVGFQQRWILCPNESHLKKRKYLDLSCTAPCFPNLAAIAGFPFIIPGTWGKGA